MILIVCLDQRNGLRFNNRRQSSDRCVIERIVLMSEGKKLYITPDAVPLFPGVDCVASERIPELASSGDICFAETGDFSEYLDKTEKLIIYRWDKVYPSDTKFPIDRFLKSLSLKSTEIFSGTSHDRIAQEVYSK